jgi:hypothetical protein
VVKMVNWESKRSGVKTVEKDWRSSGLFCYGICTDLTMYIPCTRLVACQIVSRVRYYRSQGWYSTVDHYKWLAGTTSSPDLAKLYSFNPTIRIDAPQLRNVHAVLTERDTCCNL